MSATSSWVVGILSLNENPAKLMVQTFLSITINRTGPHRVVDVDDVVLPGPGVGVDPDPVQVALLVHSCQHRPMQLEGPEHRGSAGAALGTNIY